MFRRFKSNRDEIRKFLHEIMHQLTESDFRFDATLSSWRLLRHFTQKVLPPGEWTRSVCRATTQQRTPVPDL